jgi:hypothetical protein
LHEIEKHNQIRKKFGKCNTPYIWDFFLRKLYTLYLGTERVLQFTSMKYANCQAYGGADLRLFKQFTKTEISVANNSELCKTN